VTAAAVVAENVRKPGDAFVIFQLSKEKKKKKKIKK